jgi:two-component system sensor histidine kinase/response regulator
MAEQNIVDRAALDMLLESVGGDREFFAELLDSFLNDAPAQLAAMRTATVGGDAEALRRAAHSLKSNSATFGAMRLSQQCKRIEELARAGEWQGTPDRIENVAVEYEQVRTALGSMLGSI